MKKFNTSLFFVFSFFLIKAQTFADKDFYLVDSIVLEGIDTYSINILDSVLHLYHSTNDDTLQLSYIDFLVSNIGEFDMLWKYNDFMFLKANESFQSIKNKTIKNKIKFYIATSYGNKGTLYSFENEDDSTFYYYTKSLASFSEINDLSGIANMNGSLGVYYDIKGEVKKALYYYNAGLKAAETSGNNQSIAMASLNIASIQKDYREYNSAIENGNKGIKYSILADDQQTLIMAYQLLSNIYIRTGDFQNAKKMAIKSIDVCKKINSEYWIVDGYVLLGKTYFGLGQIDSSEHYFTLAKYEAEQINAVDIKMIALQGLAKNANVKKDYSNAKAYASEAYQISLKLKSKDYTSKSSKILSEVFEMKGDYKKALEYSHIYSSLKDSIHNSANQKDAIRLGIQYDYEKEVALIEQEKTFAEKLAIKNKNLFIASVVLGILALLIALFFIYQVQLKKRAELAELKLSETENKLELERKYRTAELKALKSQMNPHFLFNAFNSIQEFIILNKKEVASEYLGKFSDLMRLYLEQSRNSEIHLEEELRSLGLYLELEKVRFGNSLDFEIKVDKEIDKFSTNIPPLIIQPFVENALKHGLLHKKTERKLWVSFKKEKNSLVCSVKDNGIGRKQSSLLNKNRVKMHKSFAISSIENRIELLNVNRENDITLAINDLYNDENIAQGTEVILTIPT